MNAVISGTAGRALLVDGKSLMSFDVDDPSKLVVRQQSDLPYLFGEGRDLRVIEHSDIESIARELEAESNLALALDLTLISLDEELEEDIRRDALQDLDELLSNDLRDSLEGILYARPLPDERDLIGSLKFCEKSHLPNSFALLEGLERRQPLIEKVSAVWDVIPTKVFGGDEQRSYFQQIAVQRGLFRLLVIALEHQSGIPKFLLNAGLDSAVQQLRNYRQVLQAWSASFRKSDEAVTMMPDAESEFEAKTSPRRRHGRRVGLNRPAVLREVNKRKGGISAAIRRHDMSLVKQLVDDLVDYQRENGEIEHAAKSLCDLAMEAKELGMFSLQLDLTERSISVAPDDGWSWAQQGDALLNMGLLDRALTAFHQAWAFGAGVVAKAGQGEVLKAMGHFEGALAAFEEAIAQDPNNVVAKNGRAEVLKVQGEFKGALAAFEEVIRQHPENVVAKSGRAEVLKAQGEFKGALAAFDEVIRQHPDDVVAKTGRAEVLKAQGEFKGALAAYDEVRNRFPDDAITRNGRIWTLVALGRYDEAIEGLPGGNPAGLEDWIAFHIRGMVLMRMRRIEEAIQIFQRGVSENPFPSSAAYFQVALAVALIRQGKYRDANSLLADIDAPNLKPQVDILRLHASGEEKQFEEATVAFQELTPKPWSISDELLDELHRRYILKAPPKKSNEWVFDQEETSLLLVAGQQTSVISYAY
ncbi:MAG TPA: tetratricopeptide repeat protein [Pyrinomonadaceae bacterium]|nr:tetratricopeptide repeat protein [Pyrinomonadaceae bacterium]